MKVAKRVGTLKFYRLPVGHRRAVAIVGVEHRTGQVRARVVGKKIASRVFRHLKTAFQGAVLWQGLE